ncbi:MAG: DUF192 domain-containing protein [Myxococcota bacterium]
MGWVLTATAFFVTACASAATDDPACEGPEAYRIPVTVDTKNGPVTFSAEVADTERERARGLMFRDCLPEDEGMLFLSPRPFQQSFWMRNTLIPLDIIFIREDRRILGIVEEASPRTDTHRSVPGASQFVLEIAGGLSKELGIEAGQRVRFTAPLPEH